MQVKEVPQFVTVVFFVLYFVITNLCLLNLFIAAILERLKITQVTTGTLSDAARAALVMKEFIEAEAAQDDLDHAVAYLHELKDTGGSVEEIAEAEQIAADANDILQKEVHESLETMESIAYCGIQPSHFAMGCWGPKSKLRQCCQRIVHSTPYYWTVCAIWACTIIVPCFKNKFDSFDQVDRLTTIGFATLMFLEVALKCFADGFLWTLPTIVGNEAAAAVYHMDQNPDEGTWRTEEALDRTEKLAQHTALPTTPQRAESSASEVGVGTASGVATSSDPAPGNAVAAAGAGAQADTPGNPQFNICDVAETPSGKAGNSCSTKRRFSALETIKQSYATADTNGDGDIDKDECVLASATGSN